ncbi:MAG TPA: hypothetical protein DEA52_02275, partial [Clostridiaceae bacterium]|nr:hypothetical protein [Clostridiaceae bacterium]
IWPFLISIGHDLPEGDESDLYSNRNSGDAKDRATVNVEIKVRLLVKGVFFCKTLENYLSNNSDK